MIQAIDFPIILFDGTSVSNPGAAAAASVILLPNGRRYTFSQFLSLATDQEAIYTGLIIGLRKAKQLGLRRLEIKVKESGPMLMLFCSRKMNLHFECHFVEERSSQRPFTRYQLQQFFRFNFVEVTQQSGGVAVC